jgi:hypothetical protein
MSSFLSNAFVVSKNDKTIFMLIKSNVHPCSIVGKYELSIALNVADR